MVEPLSHRWEGAIPLALTLALTLTPTLTLLLALALNLALALARWEGAISLALYLPESTKEKVLAPFRKWHGSGFGPAKRVTLTELQGRGWGEGWGEGWG